MERVEADEQRRARQALLAAGSISRYRRIRLFRTIFWGSLRRKSFRNILEEVAAGAEAVIGGGVRAADGGRGHPGPKGRLWPLVHRARGSGGVLPQRRGQGAPRDLSEFFGVDTLKIDRKFLGPGVGCDSVSGATVSWLPVQFCGAAPLVRIVDKIFTPTRIHTLDQWR